MKYLKRFETEPDYVSYKNGDTYILPNISFINDTSSIKSEPYKPPIRRIATFEVTDQTSNILFSNCEAIKSIKVNGVTDNDYIPYKGEKEVIVNNVDIFNSINLGIDLFVQDENNDFYFNIFDIINSGNYNYLLQKFQAFNNFNETIIFDEDINLENLVLCIGINNMAECNQLSTTGVYILNDNKTLVLNEEIKNAIEYYESLFDFILIYDKTNPYKKYSFTTIEYDGTKTYYVNNYGKYEVEIELKDTNLPIDMFSPLNFYNESVTEEYQNRFPLISINNDFLKDCTIPSFAYTNLTNILIPSSSKLPIPFDEKYYNLNFREFNTYWDNYIHGLFSQCVKLENIVFEENTIISQERLLNFIRNCESLKKLDFKNVIWNHNDNELYEKIEYIGYQKNNIHLNYFLDANYSYNETYRDNIEYINLNGMIGSNCTNFRINSGYERFNNLKEIDFGKCDFSNITDMNFMFNYCNSLKTIRMSGPLNENVFVNNMFYGVAENGEFYYDSNYDYSRIISVLPSTWVAIPF